LSQPISQNNLHTLRVQGQRQVTSLEGLGSCARLEDVGLLDMRVSSLAPLAGAVALRKLWILGHYKILEQVWSAALDDDDGVIDGDEEVRL
jgi:hypothetical protein